MSKYYVTITLPIDVPEQWDTDDGIEEFITDILDKEVAIAYEIDDFGRA